MPFYMRKGFSNNNNNTNKERKLKQTNKAKQQQQQQMNEPVRQKWLSLAVDEARKAIL